MSVFVSLLSLSCNGSAVNTFQGRRFHTTVEEFLDASFSMRSVSCQRRACWSACISHNYC
jgi:hypothetical protein